MEIISRIPTLQPRRPEAHKGDYGRILIIGGSVGMSGAAALAGRAALRAGAGLVRIATARSALPIVASIDPCYTTIGLPEDHGGRIDNSAIDQILDAIGDSDVVVFGPGIGQGSGLRSITARLIGIKDVRLLIDADGLNNLARLKDWHTQLRTRPVLTPHPGEMVRLWASVTDAPRPQDRVQWACGLVEKVPSVLVLKGAGTVVTDGQRLYVNTTGNPGMATAGAGDVLSGIIAALMGQGLSDLDAAVLGTYIHGLAGDIAADAKGQISLVATDLIEALPAAFRSLSGN